MGTLRLRSLGGCSAQGDSGFVIGSERSESKNPPKLGATLRTGRSCQPCGDPSTHSSDSFAQGDNVCVNGSERSELNPASEIRTKRVLVVADLPVWEGGLSFDGHDVEATRPIPQIVPGEIGRRRSCQSSLFFGIDGAHGAAEEIGRSRLDLDEDNLTSPLDDQIEFATGAAPVAMPRPVTLEQEQRQGHPLSATTQSSAIHGVWFHCD